MPRINSCFTAISHIQIFPYAQTTGISSGKKIYVVYLPINWGGFGALRLVFWQLSCSLTCTQLTKCQGCFWCCCCYRTRCPCLRRGVARQAQPGNYSCCSCSASSCPLPPYPTSRCKVETPLCTSAEPLWKIITCLRGSPALRPLNFVPLSAQSWKSNGRIPFHWLVELEQHLTLRQLNRYCGNKHRDMAGPGGGEVYKLQGKKRSPM